MTRGAAIVALFLLAALSARRLAAQPIQPVGLTRTEAELFFEARYRADDETRGPQHTENRERDLLLREGLDLLLAGYAYHPNLLDWTADLRVGMTQQDAELSGMQRDSEGTLLGYNLSAILLKEKPLSLRAYATRSDTFEDRSFARNLDLVHTSEGAQLMLKGDIPASLLLEHRTVDEKSDTREDDEEAYLVRFSVEDRRNRDSLTRLVFEHEEVDQTTRFLNPGGGSILLDFPDRRDELVFTNNWLFDAGDGRRHRLDGQVRVLDRSGFFENQAFVADQMLTLQHTDDFSTFYRGMFSLDETELETDRQWRGEAGFNQRIYESLDITGRGFITDRQLENGFEKSIGTLFDLDYRKLTPVGVYRSSLTAGLEFNEERFEGGSRFILDEPVSLTGVSRSALDEPNVTPGSIRVTDVSQFIVYVEGVDYLLRRTGALTEIRRLVGGAIGDGQTVFVDYLVPAVDFAEFETRLLDFRHRLDFDDLPLSLYANLRWRDHVLTGGEDPGNLDREQTQLYGFEYRPIPLRLVGEYERREHEIFPSWHAWRGRVGYMDVFADAASVNVGIEYEMLNYLDGGEFGLGPGDDFLETHGAFANVTVKLTRELLVRLDGLYYDTRGRDDDLLARVGGGLTWRKGRLEVTLDGHYDIWEQEIDEGTSIVIELGVKRRF